MVPSLLSACSSDGSCRGVLPGRGLNEGARGGVRSCICFVSRQRRCRENGVDERVGVGVVDLVHRLEAVVGCERLSASRVRPELLRVRQDVGVGLGKFGSTTRPRTSD
jgi:hypothetical protein